MAKNCNNCRHLQYADPEYEQGFCSYAGGFYCEKRDTSTAKKERELLRKLECDTYRGRGKRCFEPKSEGK